MDFWIAVAIGGAGAMAAEFLPIHALRYTPKEQWPPWATSVRFWLLTVLGCCIGAGFAGGYSTGTEMTWYLAANVGAAWPSILNGLARAVPEFTPPEDEVN